MSATSTIAAAAALDRRTITPLLGAVDTALRGRPARLTIDLTAVESFDSAGLGGVVDAMRRGKTVGTEVRLKGLSQPMLDFFSLVSVQRMLQPGAGDNPRAGLVRAAGAMVEPLADAFSAVVGTAAAVVQELAVAPFRRRGIRLDRLAIEIDSCAVGALPIVALIAFLLGLILAMQAWVQLRVWGAEIYVADMVGVSVLSEIGPLMTAIVLAARSGSSNAAQLGAMVVNEEIAALEQMGIRPLAFLVVPKVLACAFAAVALGVVFDVVAICGGGLFAHLVADIELAAFAEQLRTALQIGDFTVAMGKSVAFGAGVGVVGCALGMRVQGGSEGVGRATTQAVVLGVFLIIVVDAAFVTVQRMVWA
ncbi:MAG: ABC transporter permease [Planctomycetes bacterium]|nr:ABC transporter permease [Planctomycetota bacterium]